jgi:hypothetical protein
LPNSSGPSLDKASVVSKALVAVQRILLISDFTLVNQSLAFIPIIGRPLSVCYMSIIDAFYAFE